MRKSCLRVILAAGVSLAMLSGIAAQTAVISDDVVKIGVLTDMSGTYSDFAGPGSVEAVKMAIEDFGGTVRGKPVQMISADHQNKADVGANIVRGWYDQDRVDLVLDTTNSAVTLAVMNVTKEKNKIVMIGGSSTQRATTDACTPNSIQYVYDASALSNVTAKALLQGGGKKWFFITVDFAFGLGLEKNTAEVVKANGGTVVGSVRHPVDTSDFSSYILQAQGSGADIIALANGGRDTINTIKTANEFGVTGSATQKVASLLTFITDIHSMGLKDSRGIVLTEAFYWDMNDETRGWSKRFFERTKRMPTMVQVAMYSAALQYLKAVEATGSDATETVMAKLKATPINDVFVKNGRIRPDGLHVHDMYLMQVKTPGESRYPWDYYKVLRTVPGEEAFSPMASGACAFLAGK